MRIDDGNCTQDKVNIVGSGCTIIPNKNHASVIIGGKTSKIELQHYHDSLIDGVEIFGGYSTLSSGGKNTQPERLFTGSIRGITMLGAGSTVQNENSWTHKQYGSEFLFQQGILLVGRSSSVSLINEGTLISGEYLTREVMNQGVVIIGKPSEPVPDGVEIETTDTVAQGKYNALSNEGIIIAGYATGYHPYIEFPSTGNEKYAEFRGNIRLSENCNICDKNGRQLVKNGVLASK